MVKCEVCGREFGSEFGRLLHHSRKHPSNPKPSYTRTEAHNRAMSEALRGKKLWGGKRPEMSAWTKGEKNPNYGGLSKTHIEKMKGTKRRQTREEKGSDKMQKTVQKQYRDGRRPWNYGLKGKEYLKHYGKGKVWNKGLTEETDERVAKYLKGMREAKRKGIGVLRGKDSPLYGNKGWPPHYFVKELGHKVRSSWEEEIGSILKRANITYGYESKTFEFNGTTYTPDFIVEPNILIDPKGYLPPEQERRLKIFIQKFSEYFLILIGAGDETVCRLHLDWEKRYRLPEIIEQIIKEKRKAP